jgi:hypothetical protein
MANRSISFRIGLRSALPALAFVAVAAHAQTSATPPPAPPQATPAEPPQATPSAPSQATPDPTGLADLDSTTFSCAKAGLNAAAREARKAPTQGTYQFSYFRIISNAHHAAYEVHFKSNYPGEKDLRYCVAIYCQQGWDPANTEPAITALPEPRRTQALTATEAAAATDCSRHNHAPARLKNIVDPAQAKPK